MMNEGISVRTCTAADVETLLSLSIKTFRDTFDDFNSPDNMLLYINNTFTKKLIQQEMKKAGTIFLLAFDGRKAVGYAKLKESEKLIGPHAEKGYEIERLYALREYIGKRVGYMLMQTCLSFAKKGNYKTLWLGVWEHNERAISFYTKYGFEKFGQHVFMLGDDAQTDWLMKKEIT
jgi:ribosomal protein S18 acetylase RimI-like enzyme